MSDPAVAVYTIGQTPRPDLTEGLMSRFRSVRFQVVGALDGLSADRIPMCRSDGYPLETRLNDGARVVVDAAFVEQRIRRSIEAWDDHIALHLVLCAGPFPNLGGKATVILPFEATVTELQHRDLASLEILVPFRAQEAPALRKWEGAGFDCRARTLADKPDEVPIARWLFDSLAAPSAEALVLDYVGLSAAIVDEVSASSQLPVFDLGCVALDSLERRLMAL